MKERRRLLDESKSTGKETKSNWPYYDSMEFLSSHLRLPCNNAGSANTADRFSLTNGEDEDSLKYSGDSPTTSLVSPPNNPNDSGIKQEMTTQSQATEWPTSTSQVDKQSYSSTQVNSEILNNNNSVLNPTNYPSAFFGRPAAPAFTHNPLWAMWANNMQQASQHLNNIRAASNQQMHSSATTSSPHQMIAEQPPNQTEQREEESRRGKRKRRQSDGQDINIQLSLKDIQPAERYSEYHFCLSLAQMMEDVPPNRRPDLKVRLIQAITEASACHQNVHPAREDHINV